MFRFAVLISLLALLAPRAEARLQQQPSDTPSATVSGPLVTETPIATQFVTIQSPSAGQALQGNIPVLGKLPESGFSSAELLFSYADNPTGTWFLIQNISAGPEGSPLAMWDTTTISDGTYTLRLVVRLADGSEIEQSVSGLRVRNYTRIETDTPTPATPSAAPVLVGTPTRTLTPTPPPPTPTPFPPNPAQLTSQQYRESFGKGALAVFGLFALLGLYWITRGRRR
jgi:hypothetical protein